ncbi:hypothetical protein [Shewanella septentrionalis]|uniref:Uncharacterized protein n=1 Tax=Shewanella septentrionalis TaxID=2952223 RepID=A0A9X2WXJ5_9GAMM|nr:hypothetical protein [Shewanella septentrionalis]MCT7947171.1 hypothetical protein [Shewanella septentrionalis]
MENIFKETLKKSPIITLAIALPYAIFTKILDLEFNIEIITIIILSTVAISYLTIYLKLRKKIKSEIKISEQEIENIKTDGGDFLIGTNNLDSESIIIEKNTVKGVETGGGNFTVGVRRD